MTDDDGNAAEFFIETMRSFLESMLSAISLYGILRP